MHSTTSTLKIREARLDDAPVLAALLAELGFPAPVSTVSMRLEAMLLSGESVLVAEYDDQPVGVVTIHITPVLHRPTPVGRMTALVVHERMRGRGIGRALVEAAEQLVATRGCALLEVTSNRRLTDAHRFYERLGYEETSLRFTRAVV